jgi:hypothetical protein
MDKISSGGSVTAPTFPVGTFITNEYLMDTYLLWPGYLGGYAAKR